MEEKKSRPEKVKVQRARFKRKFRKESGQLPSRSFARETSYKTMGSLKTAASDNSFQKNLMTMGSGSSSRSNHSL